LEFRASEVLVQPDGAPIAAWLWQRPAPHDLAIVPGGAGGVHHAAQIARRLQAQDAVAMARARIETLLETT
jgi:hypothetical protein